MIKHAPRWLNAGCWADERPPLEVGGTVIDPAGNVVAMPPPQRHIGNVWDVALAARQAKREADLEASHG